MRRDDDVSTRERSGPAENEIRKAGIHESEDDCRCKEAKEKTIPELLKIMLQDLAFWKKPRE